MKLEKYGIKMQGLKKAAGETKHLDYKMKAGKAHGFNRGMIGQQ